MNLRYNALFSILLLIFYFVFIKYVLEAHIDLPEGTWKDSCTVLSWSNPELTAECVDLKGRQHITSINLNQCTEIELDPEQTEKRNEGRDLEHRHYHGDKGMYFHVHKLINDNGNLLCDSIIALDS
jgi:hypothetical protein